MHVPYLEKYKVIQSIGQNGIVGRVELNNKDVQQGFLTNTRYFSVRNSDNVNFKETFPIVISPNPFVDYIKIDLRSIKTITGIRIDSLYEISEHVYRNFNLHGVHVIITKQDSLDRPVAITPIISSTGTSHSFTFPGTQWDSDSHDDLELKFLQ